MYNQLQAQKFRIHDYQRHTELTFLADHHNNIFYRNAFVNLYIYLSCSRIKELYDLRKQINLKSNLELMWSSEFTICEMEIRLSCLNTVPLHTPLNAVTLTACTILLIWVARTQNNNVTLKRAIFLCMAGASVQCCSHSTCRLLFSL